jgi:hypothetical protein
MERSSYLRRIAGLLTSACLLASFPPLTPAFEDEEGGWQPGHYVQPEPWKEGAIELPAYPQRKDLLPVKVNTGGQPYTIYIDPGSLTKDEDGVVRYTVVLISAADVWNVSYEGLRCGENSFRRYAYGFDGEWRDAGQRDWKPITGLGINRYRRIFYDYFMCNPSELITNAEQILRNIRSPSRGLLE